MSVETIDLRDLAKELDDLRERFGDDDATLNEDDRERLDVLEAFAKDFEANVGDLDSHSRDEPTAVSAQDFKEYAQDLAYEVGCMPKDLNWPLTCIDWERAANELEHDYTSFTYDGNDYLTRA